MSGRRADGVPAHRVRLRRRAAAVCALLGVCAALAVPPPGATEATWADPEVERGSFTAITVPAPEALDCVYSPGLLGIGSSVTLQWKLPAGHPQYGASNVELGYVNSSGVLSVILASLLTTTTQTVSGGVYTTKVTSALALDIFSSSKSLGVRVVDASGWTSSWAVGNARSGVLGSGSTCTISSVPSV